MTMLSDAMHRLIEPWTLTVTVGEQERVQQFPPLVDMLRGRITPDSNQTGGGGSAVNTRNVLDVKSLDLLMSIQDVTRAWLQEWAVPTIGELKLDLRGFWDKLAHLRTSGAIDDVTHDHLAAYPDKWAQLIWDQFETPKRIPLRNLECPSCGRAKFTNENGDTVDNVFILWRNGQEPTAECQWRDCALMWVGDEGLERLGRDAGLEIDVVALREARNLRHG